MERKPEEDVEEVYILGRCSRLFDEPRPGLRGHSHIPNGLNNVLQHLVRINRKHIPGQPRINLLVDTPRTRGSPPLRYVGQIYTDDLPSAEVRALDGAPRRLRTLASQPAYMKPWPWLASRACLGFPHVLLHRLYTFT